MNYSILECTYIYTENFPLKYTVTTNEVETKINPSHILFYTSAQCYLPNSLWVILNNISVLMKEHGPSNFTVFHYIMGSRGL
jgi:hypothetical protein